MKKINFKNKIENKSNKGASLLISIMFFFTVSTAFLTGVTFIAVRDVSSVNTFLNSRGAFTITESLHEDVVYRLKNSMDVSETETISLNGGYATTTYLSSGYGATITTTGSKSDYTRKIRTEMTLGAGSVFNYAIFIDGGGINMGNGSSIQGSIYSNGSIIGNGSISSTVSNPIQLINTEIIDGSSNDGFADMVFSEDKTAFYTVGSEYIGVYSIVNKASPRFISMIDYTPTTTTQFYASEVKGDYLYLSAKNNSKLYVFNISSTTNPILTSTLDLGSAPERINAGPEGYLFVSMAQYVGGGILKIINITNPANPSVAKTLNMPSYVYRAFMIDNNYMYVMCEDGNYTKIHIYSMQNPSNPIFVKNVLNTTLYNNVHILPIFYDNKMYIASTYFGSLYVLNVSSTTNPTLIYNTSYNVSFAKSISVGAGYLYIPTTDRNGTSANYFQIWSLSNPGLPTKVYENDMGGASNTFYPHKAHLIDGYVYFMEGSTNDDGKYRVFNARSTGVANVTGDVVSAGPNGYVQNVVATGTIYAHGINNSIAGKDAYFALATNTSVYAKVYQNSTDMPTSSPPVATSTITVWEDDALSGGTISSPCPYNINSPTTLGPKKINCDLNINANLTLSGNIWVNGNITVSNNVHIYVDNSISGRTPVIIADKPTNRATSSKIIVNNNIVFDGNGTNSYIMMLSMNESALTGGTTKAIDFQNNISGDSIIYAPSGLISLGNNATTREISGYKISLSNNAIINYETGVSDVVFTTSPTAAYQILSWKEVED